MVDTDRFLCYGVRVTQPRRLAPEEVFRKFEVRIMLAGSLNRAAREMGLSPTFLSLVLEGHRLPGNRTLANVGVRRVQRKVIEYYEIDPDQPAPKKERGVRLRE
jgi:hypothetical protein